MTPREPRDPNLTPDAAASLAAVLRAKFTDILAPGYEVEFDPDEAEQAGAFEEDALGEQDAAESCLDLVGPGEAAPGRERESS